MKGTAFVAAAVLALAASTHAAPSRIQYNGLSKADVAAFVETDGRESAGQPARRRKRELSIKIPDTRPKIKFFDASEEMEVPGIVGVKHAPHPNGTSGHHTPGGDEYIVLFDRDRDEVAEVSDVLHNVGLKVVQTDVNHIYRNSAFRGFSGPMGNHCINALDGMGEVKLVEPAVKIEAQGFQERKGSSWALQRISQVERVVGDVNKMDFTYRFDDSGGLGRGVDIYILDSGLNIDHAAFGGRATVGFSRDGPNDLDASSDADGHGTHVAGIAAGDTFGVAPEAKLIGVKVLGKDGVGSSADAVKGFDYVIRRHNERKAEPGFVGSIASLSWSLPSRSRAIEQVIEAAVEAGIHVSVAAGNQGIDACSQSPSSSGGRGADGVDGGGPAVTVGAFNSRDAISEFSNTGACVDVFAPGEAIISSWIGGPTTVQSLDGTSMACPVVTGIMAYLMGLNKDIASSPQQMKRLLAKSSVVDTGSRSTDGIPLLASNGIWSVEGASAAAQSKIAEHPDAASAAPGQQLRNGTALRSRSLRA